MFNVFLYIIKKENQIKNQSKNKVKFITCIYSNLHGTNFGGRNDRDEHYKYSLLSLLKMYEADFVCYTSISEYESLCYFFYKLNNISNKQLSIKIYNLKQNYFKNLINKYKNENEIKISQRCYEIQYMKFIWLSNEDMTYDYYFWIDSGLSFDGLIPKKYLNYENNNKIGFNSPLFNNHFLKNLLYICSDKFLLISKENSKFHYADTVSIKHYKKYDSSRHIVAGLFGGKKEIINNIIEKFKYYLEKITNEDKKLYYEEAILSLMNYNDSELFICLNFDTWYHEDTNLYTKRINKYNIGDDNIYNEIKNYKSFYQIIEELQ